MEEVEDRVVFDEGVRVVVVLEVAKEEGVVARQRFHEPAMRRQRAVAIRLVIPRVNMALSGLNPFATLRL